MAQEKQTVYVFDDGSWQSHYLIEELKKNDTKNVKTIEAKQIKGNELEDAEFIDFKKDYLAKIPENLAKDKGLVIWLHFTSEDYSKTNNNTKDAQSLNVQKEFLKAEYPNVKFHFGYQFQAREKLRNRFMALDEKGKMSPDAEAMHNRIILEKKNAKVEKFKEIEEQAAKEHEFDDKKREEKLRVKPQVPEGAGEPQPTTEAEEKTIIDTMQEQGIKVPTQEISEESEPEHTTKRRGKK